ncbi:hypothetical protein Rxyl_2977 [Rubrobacter xylanophilus DSM 9941]|uniref:Uncharacterized protein n=1 Tax=Rubrobacter xylanophilus (strain DSM 9941 / JCM 11954 / NBRC 16129 / PRD-1) TaxID=266117 RepID=Q1ARU1_RUBXD|nr:hypothetical protein [Rubrobacter xylanophilus]ABG05887.1 hypothetical protein Rxyl_2977 [Rubrobacter xylanophilus DSM 9941]
MARSPAEDYRRKAERELDAVLRRLRQAAHPLPSGDLASGLMLVVEDPAGPRLLDALRRSLAAIGLPDAYVTHASSGLLRQELHAADPALLVAVGPGAARSIDDLGYPLARRRFSDAPEGEPFPWTGGTPGLRLPSLAPALDSETAKRRFWRAFLALRNLPPLRPAGFL